jgi:hypothetical protein
MKNIMATSRLRRPTKFSPLALLLAASMLASTLWGIWATQKLVMLERRTIVTVQLSRIMGDFVGNEARSGRPAELVQARTLAYLKAVDASVAALAKGGRTVLVGEAVVAGSVPDLTEPLRADVARRMEALSRAAQ